MVRLPGARLGRVGNHRGRLLFHGWSSMLEGIERRRSWPAFLVHGRGPLFFKTLSHEGSKPDA
jgi:hypothetical protein